MRPLRDFFIVLFFVVLGSNLELANLAGSLSQAAIFSILILVGNPIIVMTIMGVFKFTRKTSFKAGLTVAQISEFSLILLLLGRQVGHLNDEVIAMMTLVAMSTIAASTYSILYSDKLYTVLEPYLKIFERKNHRAEKEHKETYDIVMFGFKAGSRSLIDAFKKMNKKFLVVDYDPETIDTLKAEDIPCLYGDADDTDFLEELPLEKAKLVIVTMTEFEANALIVEHVLHRNNQVAVIAKAVEPHEATDLYEKGASYVMMAHLMASESLSKGLVKGGLKSDYLEKAKNQHLQYLHYSIK